MTARVRQIRRVARGGAAATAAAAGQYAGVPASIVLLHLLRSLELLVGSEGVPRCAPAHAPVLRSVVSLLVLFPPPTPPPPPPPTPTAEEEVTRRARRRWRSRPRACARPSAFAVRRYLARRAAVRRALCARARLQLELFKLGAPLPLLCLCLLWPPTAAPPRLAHTLALLSHSKYHASGRALFMRLLPRGLVEALPRRPAAFLRTFHSESRTPTLVWTAAMREQLGVAVEAELASWEERGSSWAWEEFGVAYRDTEGLLQVDGVYLSLYIEQRPTLTSPRSFYAALLRALPPLVAKLPRRGEPPADLVRTVAAVTTLIQLQPEAVFGADADADADGANGAAEGGALPSILLQLTAAADGALLAASLECLLALAAADAFDTIVGGASTADEYLSGLLPRLQLLLHSGKGSRRAARARAAGTWRRGGRRWRAGSSTAPSCSPCCGTSRRPPPTAGEADVAARRARVATVGVLGACSAMARAAARRRR